MAECLRCQHPLCEGTIITNAEGKKACWNCGAPLPESSNLESAVGDAIAKEPASGQEDVKDLL